MYFKMFLLSLELVLNLKFVFGKDKSDGLYVIVIDQYVMALMSTGPTLGVKLPTFLLDQDQISLCKSYQGTSYKQYYLHCVLGGNLFSSGQDLFGLSQFLEVTNSIVN